MHRYLLVVLALGAAACYPRTAPPPGELSTNALTQATQRWPDASAESLGRGRKLFLESCGSCHGYPDLAAVPEKEWPSIMKSMAKKSELSAADGELVLRYILAAR